MVSLGPSVSVLLHCLLILGQEGLSDLEFLISLLDLRDVLLVG